MTPYLLDLSGLIHGLGERTRALRLHQNQTQRDLARNAGVGLKALRRFEACGEGSVETMVRVAVALGAGDPFAHLFEPPPVRSLAELEAPAPMRKRARPPR